MVRFSSVISTSAEIMRCPVEEYFHHYHIVVRSTWKDVISVGSDNFDFIMEGLGLEWTSSIFW